MKLNEFPSLKVAEKMRLRERRTTKLKTKPTLNLEEEQILILFHNIQLSHQNPPKHVYPLNSFE